MKNQIEGQQKLQQFFLRSDLPDAELCAMEQFIQESVASGLSADPISITNLYVGMKSKPLTLLIGPENSGKIEAVRSMAKCLMGDDSFRFQTMIGHPYWASKNSNVVLFTESQLRWNSIKILELIQEACSPQNRYRILIGCMTRISPAELIEFFSSIAFQLRSHQVMRIASYHLTEPLPFPRNMFLIGTMDTDQFKWGDEDLLAKTSLIAWYPDKTTKNSSINHSEAAQINEELLIKSCHRSPQSAFQKLHRIFGEKSQAFNPLLQTEKILRRYGVRLFDNLLTSAIVFIANSWSDRDAGLFTRDFFSNLDTALDLAITQNYLLPIQDQLADCARLCHELRSIFKDRFPRATAFVENVADN